MEESLPPGFRFHPTDEELITHYLDRKISDFTFTSKAIVDVDLNKCEPWDLPAKASMGEKEWYFFSMRDRKYPTGLRTNRATEAGYWKTTGKDKEIFRGRVLVGMKKTLVFYRGRAPKGEKTNWVMHEYRLETNLSYKSNKEEWVVCRVFQKSSIKKAQQCSPQTSMGSPEDTNMTVNEFNDIEVPYTNLLSTSPSDFIHNIMSTQGYSTETNINNHLNNQLNSSPTMNWPTRSAPGSLPSLLSWASSLLSPTLHNTLLEKALQLRGYEVKDALATVINNDDASSFFPVTNLGISGPSTSNHPHQVDSTNLQAPSTSNVSMEIESISSSQQQHQHQQMRTEQPFDLDSLW